MSPLRNRVGSRLREPFGKAGLTVAVIALVFAAIGGAWAATGLNSKQKKEVKAIAKSFQGTGPAGAAGAAGPAGAKGDTGAQGKEGKEGPQGKPGKDGTFSTEPLPSNQSLSGAWGAGGSSGTNGLSLAAISFPIRVSPAPTTLYPAEALGFTIGVELKDGESSGYQVTGFEPAELEASEAAYLAACPGNADDPEAGPGFLCLYPGKKQGVVAAPGANATLGMLEGANEFGIVVPFNIETGNASISGAWAVTAS